MVPLPPRLPPHRGRPAATFAGLAVVAVLALPGVPRAVTAQDAGGIGDVDFQVSCEPAVQEDFDRAVALLHHMMYQEARSTFQAIADEDPSCGMAFWGAATTMFQPLWPARPSEQDRERAWQALQRAREVGVGTDRERALLRATEAFFQDPSEDVWWPRIRRWADAMEEARMAHPGDADVAALYGLSLLAAGQVADDQRALNARAAEVLAEVHERKPLHPGAIHYTIHANDISGRAGESPGIVGSYDGIAPSVPHALHMPSHIYVRLGAWPDVIEWNRKSADAALDFPAGDRLSLHYAHALDYLLYAHLQRGDDGRAGALLEELQARDDRFQEDFATAFHLAVMPARYAVERRAWDRAAVLAPRAPDYLAWDRYRWPEALSWVARGLGAVHTGDLPAAREAEARLEELRQQAAADDEQAFATYIEIDRLILSGWLAQVQGESQVAEARIREAAELEGTVEKHPITPGALLPPYEALGDLLMEQERPMEALEAYEASLEIWPNRYRSLLGAARAARDAGEAQRSQDHYRTLLDVTRGSDSDRPGVREARQALGD